MSGIAWQIEHSVETIANLDFAWSFMTDVANWDDPPARFFLDGPFAEGSRGITRMPGQPSSHWTLHEVATAESYSIEFPLENAVLYFKWRFAPLPGGGTRLTQHILLHGENAAEYLPVVQQTFALSLQPGMARIAAAMNAAWASRSSC